MRKNKERMKIERRDNKEKERKEEKEKKGWLRPDSKLLYGLAVS